MSREQIKKKIYEYKRQLEKSFDPKIAEKIKELESELN